MAAARKPKTRYMAKSNTYANGIALDGLVYVDMGLCLPNGGKSKIKTDLTHRHLRAEEPKALKARGLRPDVWKDRHIEAKHLNFFYELIPS